jgi:tetratricopeptide (TPR) repeat protein
MDFNRPRKVRARTIATAADARGPELELAAVSILMGFHEFGQATQALERAAALGASPQRVESLRAALDHATGADWPGTAVTFTDGDEPVLYRVHVAAWLFERGEPDAAAQVLRAAQDAYYDSAPFTLAWIHLQQGIQFLRQDDLTNARVFFAAAHQRFPQYVAATEHLAETELRLGHADTAMGLYESAWLQSGNPEFLAQWAVAAAALGQDAQARTLAARAQRAWATLIGRYPLMAADHGALYLLDTGQLDQALALARRNYANRQDLSARTLLVEALLASGQSPEACSEWRVIHGAGYAPPELNGLELACDSTVKGFRSAERR